MPIIKKVSSAETCPFEYDRFPDSNTSTYVVLCEHKNCQDNNNQLCEFEENVWYRMKPL